MTAVISSPYCGQQRPHAEPARAAWPARAAARRPGRAPVAGVERPARPAPAAGSAAVRCSRTAREAAVNRRIACSCACGVEQVQPGGVQPLGHRRRRRRPRSNARTASSAGTAPVTSSVRASLEPGGAQRLEGVEEADPAAQRDQHAGARRRARAGSSTSAARSPSSPAQAASWLGAGPADGRAARATRVAQPADRAAAPGSAVTPGDDQPAQRRRGSASSRRRPRRPGAARRPAVEQRRVEERVPALGHGQARDRARPRAAIGAHLRSAPATAPRPAPGTSLGFTVALGRRYGASSVADRDQPPPPAEPARRRGGLRRARRSRPAAGRAPRAWRRRGRGGGRR